jgi:hypothetical protein
MRITSRARAIGMVPAVPLALQTAAPDATPTPERINRKFAHLRRTDDSSADLSAHAAVPAPAG